MADKSDKRKFSEKERYESEKAKYEAAELRRASKERKGREFRERVPSLSIPTFLRWGQKIFVVLIFVVIVLFLGWIVYLAATGNLSAVGTSISVFLDNTGITKIFSGLGKLAIERAVQPIQKASNPWDRTITDKTDVKKYVEFLSFSPTFGDYYFNEPIDLIGSIKIYGLEEKEFSASVNCELGSDKSVAVISGFEESEIRIPKGSQRIYQTECSFLGVEKPVELLDAKIEKVKSKLNVLYKNFFTRSRVKIYTIGRDEYDRLSETGKKPFDVYNIKDKSLTSKGFTIALTGNDPLEIGLGIEASQPLGEGSWWFGVGLMERETWTGKLKSLKELKIVLPDSFEPIADKCSPFDIEGNILVLSDNEHRKIKQILKEDDKLDYKVKCKLAITEVEEGLVFKDIKSQAIYDYEFSSDTITINIFPREDIT